MVVPELRFYPHLTVFENIRVPRAVAKNRQSNDEINRLVNEVADVLELKEHLQRKPANLSGGQRQRVAMGRDHRQADAFRSTSHCQPGRQVARADAHRIAAATTSRHPPRCSTHDQTEA